MAKKLFGLWGSVASPFPTNNTIMGYDAPQQQQNDEIDIENVTINGDIAEYLIDIIWGSLLDDGVEMRKAGKDPGTAFEVGVHRPGLCIGAAKRGFETHCFEPGAKQFAICERKIKSAPENVIKNIHLYNAAAGATNEGTLPFSNAGSTGDSVGGFDMWNMKEANCTEHLIQVKQVRLDDVIKKTGKDVRLIKIDTQGNEAAVFSGLRESIRLHRLKFIIFEYWPKGIDLLTPNASLGDCVAVDLVLAPLVQAGYALYSLSMTSHPASPRPRGIATVGPLHNLRKNCEWYYELEKVYVSEEYKMGYWSDFLAVAPNTTEDFLKSIKYKRDKALGIIKDDKATAGQ